jgi:hypothetical protein
MYTFGLFSGTIGMVLMDRVCCKAPFETGKHRTAVGPWTDSGGILPLHGNWAAKRGLNRTGNPWRHDDAAVIKTAVNSARWLLACSHP